MPVHHPEPSDIAAYAAGTLREAMEVFVACHLTYCPACRAEVARLEAAAAELWMEGPAPEPSLDRASLLAALDAPAPPTCAPPPPEAGEILPAPLRARIGSWSRQALRPYPLGVRHRPLRELGTGAFLLDLPAGMHLPAHVHEGLERVLVLQGGFGSGGHDYQVGDVAIDGSDDVHDDVLVDTDERCVCLFVNEGDILPMISWLRPLARWLQ